MTEISPYHTGGLVRFLDAPSKARLAKAPAFHLPRGHLPTLDALRGIAVILVMGFHFSMQFGQDTPLTRAISHIAILGRCGVDLFFVLSGFLITGILYDARKSEGYFRTFYARRILRIMPLYYATLIVLFFVVPLLLGRTPGEYHEALNHQSWLWLHAANLGLIWGGQSYLGATGHLWSLSVEEHFYLVWPMVVLYFDRRALVKVCIGIALGSLVLRTVMMLHGDDAWICYLLTPCRFDQLAIGALVALLARGPLGLAPLVRPARWIAPIGFITLFVIFAVRDRLHDSDHADLLMPTIGYSVVAIAFAACIVLAIVARDDTRGGRLMRHPFLRMFGKFSYALYIFHPFIIHRILLMQPAGSASSAGLILRFVTFGAISFAASLGVAWISWHVWEKHFLKLKPLFVYRPLSPAVGAVSATAI